MKEITVIAFLLAVLTACQTNPRRTLETNQSPVVQQQDSSTTFPNVTDVSESFKGTLNGAAVIFEHKDFTAFRLTEKGKVSTGALNTERGFGKDEDATLYVLNPDKPQKDQKYFVRLTDGRIFMLDEQRKIIEGVEWKRTASF